MKKMAALFTLFSLVMLFAFAPAHAGKRANIAVKPPTVTLAPIKIAMAAKGHLEVTVITPSSGWKVSAKTRLIRRHGKTVGVEYTIVGTPSGRIAATVITTHNVSVELPAGVSRYTFRLPK